MWILPLVGYIGIALGFGFLTLAIGEFCSFVAYAVARTNIKNKSASGLYYLSELVEEHTVIAKRFLTRMIYGVIGLQIVLCLIDGFPFKLSMLSIISHIVYLGNMRRFPVVNITDPLFITSCGMSF